MENGEVIDADGLTNMAELMLLRNWQAGHRRIPCAICGEKVDLTSAADFRAAKALWNEHTREEHTDGQN